MTVQPPPRRDFGADLGRFAAARPQPKPGILDIVPYVPGKAGAEGVAEPVKLSANEKSWAAARWPRPLSPRPPASSTSTPTAAAASCAKR